MRESSAHGSLADNRRIPLGRWSVARRARLLGFPRVVGSAVMLGGVVAVIVSGESGKPETLRNVRCRVQPDVSNCNIYDAVFAWYAL